MDAPRDRMPLARLAGASGHAETRTIRRNVPFLWAMTSLATQQTALAIAVEPETKAGKTHAGTLAWPKTLAERIKAVSTARAIVKKPLTATEMAKCFALMRLLRFFAARIMEHRPDGSTTSAELPSVVYPSRHL